MKRNYGLITVSSEKNDVKVIKSCKRRLLKKILDYSI